MKEKESKWSRFKKWAKRHEESILFVMTFAEGAVVSGIIVKGFAHDSGYSKGLNEFRNLHKDVCNTIIDECGHQAAFEALNLIRKDPEMLDLLMKDPDKVISKVGHIYYNNDFVQKLLKSVNE